ncbi:MAG TPA: VOC family protein [Thermoanaerobaculia bacterium]
MFQSIGQIAINVHDTARAVAFYRDVLELKLLFEAPPNLAFFDCGGVRLMLSPPTPEHDHPSSILYFKVKEIENVAARLESAGAELVEQPHLIAKMPDHDLWIFAFKDTEGNTLACMEEKRGAGSSSRGA